jgi:hypothetical protein
MATYVNDLRLKEITTGDESGTWGTSTNTNLELIAEAFSYGTEAITTNADTHTTTIADGATDPGRALYLKYTGTLDSACTITIGPDTVSKVWIIENGTSGSQNIIISQGSGADITIPAGDTKVVYSDGAGAGAAFFDAFASLSVVDLKVQDDLTVTGDIDVDGTTNLDVVDIDGAVQIDATLSVGVNDTGYDVKLFGATSGKYMLWDESADLLIVSGAVESTTNFNSTSGNDLRLNAGSANRDIFMQVNGTTHMTVQGSTGNVGIGTVSPRTQTHILGTGQLTANITDAGNQGGTLTLSQNSGSAGSGGALLFAALNDSGNYKPQAGIKSLLGNGAGQGVGALAFSTRASTSATELTEAMRIDSNGNVDITYGNLFTDTTSGIFFSGGIGSFTNGVYGVGVNNMAFNVNGSERVRIDSAGLLQIACGSKTGRINMQPNPANNHFFEFYNTSDVKCGEINTADGTQTNYVTSSDYRLKEDDQPMTGATERVKALRPINFAWKVNGSRVDGFLAHEAQEVVPECVTGSKDAMRDEEYEVTPAVEEVRDEDGNVTTEAVAAVMGTRSVPDYQGIDQSKLVPLLTAALQEAITKIEDLTTRLETLENA